MRLWGHPHSTYAQKSPKLEPPISPCTQSSIECVRTLYISPPRNKFYHSQFLGYFHSYTSQRLNFTKPISKMISMVSIYCLRPVYTFLNTIINSNVIASFVQKKKSFEILWSKNLFVFGYVRNLKPPSPLYAIVRICLDPSPPFFFFFTMRLIPSGLTSPRALRALLTCLIYAPCAPFSRALHALFVCLV